MESEVRAKLPWPGTPPPGHKHITRLGARRRQSKGNQTNEKGTLELHCRRNIGAPFQSPPLELGLNSTQGTSPEKGAKLG